MSTFSLLSIGARALSASYAALQTTGHNIANAGTAGYSRQQVQLATAGGQSTSTGFFGSGVDVRTVERAHDEFLTREAAVSQSLAAADSARQDRLTQLEKVFATGEDGIGHAAGELLNAFVDVAARPGDTAARQTALARAEDTALRFRSAGAQVDALQAGVTESVQSSVGQINALAQGVARLNLQIVRTQGAVSDAPNDLLDQRDQLVAEIGKLVQVSVVPAENGAQSLFIGGSQRLVVGGDAVTVRAEADAFDPSRTRLAVRDGGIDRALPDSMLVGGQVAGLLRFQNEDLTTARNTLGQMAAALAGAVNRQQSLGLDLSSAATAGAPMFDVGGPRVLAASTNAKAADGSDLASSVVGGVRVSSVGLTVLDASRLQASDYALAADPSGAAGAYRLTRLADGLVRSVAAGSVVDGFRVDIAAPAPAAADRFLLQPVAAAASAMRRVLNDPKGIAAASPVTATVGSANTGSASVASLGAVASVDPTLTASIAFTSDGGDYAWELRDSASSALVSSGSGVWSAGTPIALDGWEMTLDGAPKTGDTLAVARTAYPARNNGNALALVALRGQGLVGGSLGAGGAITGGATFTDAYAGAIAAVGTRVQNGASAATLSGAVAGDAEARRAGASGVNLDEEAARLMQYQQSYQAAAKVLQVAQSVMDTLLSTVRG